MAKKSAPKSFKEAKKAFEGSPADENLDKKGAKKLMKKGKKC